MRLGQRMNVNKHLDRVDDHALEARSQMSTASLQNHRSSILDDVGHGLEMYVID